MKPDADADLHRSCQGRVGRGQPLTSSPASSGEAPVIKLANTHHRPGHQGRASDIHLEPFEKNMRLRYRIDGVLMDATPPPKTNAMALASRFKIQ